MPHSQPTLILGFALLFLGLAVPGHSQTKTQPPRLLEQQVQTFLMGQTMEPTKVQVQALDERLTLPFCPKPEAFIPNTTVNLQGSVKIGVRCTTPTAWTIYVTATIHKIKRYYVANSDLVAGQLLGGNDVGVRQGWSDEVPMGVVNEGDAWEGQRLTKNTPSGAALLRAYLRPEYVINAGQTVKIGLQGPGFQIHSEGRALNRATIGQEVQVRTASGQVVTGRAQVGGKVEVGF